ncbi:MAG: hypothetical protein QOH41_4283 [Blastocatellia bacterium]|jgi:hypothetical protein|nr:hypothetical protein [Blastocatellia bacterium]
MNPASLPIFAVEAPEYVALQREMHDALRAQHPEWILPNGDSPTCDFYEARFAELLIVSLATERAYEHDKASNILREPWRGPWRSPTRDLDDPGNFTMLAEYAQARKIVFPKMASAIRKSSHENFA